MCVYCVYVDVYVCILFIGDVCTVFMYMYGYSVCVFVDIAMCVCTVFTVCL